MDVQTIVLIIIACAFGLYLLAGANVKVSFWMIVYIIICVVTASTSVNFLLQRGQQIGAMLLLILLILIYIFYGIKWFNSTTPTPGTIQWPPIVNMCPDFMVSWTGSDGKIYCYDSSNIYNLQTGSNALDTVNINGNMKAVYLIKDTSAVSTAKKLSEDTNGNKWPFAYKLQSPTLRSSVTSSMMRWEGVWDGSKLSEKNIPVP
jgi:hypothetical protein